MKIIPIFFHIYGMRNVNRVACNRYKARSVAVMVSQYLIARFEKKPKDTSSSQTLFSDAEPRLQWQLQALSLIHMNMSQ